ncbi:MAG: hypothetical protein ACLP2Y_08890 [Limisphaerales bacterium]
MSDELKELIEGLDNGQKIELAEELERRALVLRAECCNSEKKEWSRPRWRNWRN